MNRKFLSFAICNNLKILPISSEGRRNRESAGRSICSCRPSCFIGIFPLPELIHQDLTPKRLDSELERLLDDGEARRRALESLAAVAARLRGEGAYSRAAEILVAMSRGEEPPAPGAGARVLEEPEGA